MNLPTRISADKRHPWFNPVARQVGILFNGNLQRDAVTVDTEEGWMECSYMEGSVEQFETFFGKVELVMVH